MKSNRCLQQCQPDASGPEGGLVPGGFAASASPPTEAAQPARRLTPSTNSPRCSPPSTSLACPVLASQPLHPKARHQGAGRARRPPQGCSNALEDAPRQSKQWGNNRPLARGRTPAPPPSPLLRAAPGTRVHPWPRRGRTEGKGPQNQTRPRGEPAGAAQSCST